MIETAAALQGGRSRWNWPILKVMHVHQATGLEGEALVLAAVEGSVRQSMRDLPEHSEIMAHLVAPRGS